nr:hypothetical protein [Acetobacter malorum]
MITEVLIRQAEPVTRMKVDVTFMRMLRPPVGEGLALPEGWSVETNVRPDVAGYRLLQDKVGRDYCWWMRQAASDRRFAAFPGRRACQHCSAPSWAGNPRLL